ncbi:MAG: triacylglycerol lipase, partial [Myxococcota bacterium]
MSNSTKVFLVPGFFGFSSLGAMNYFEGVAPMLEKMLSRRGVEADIVNCATLPTGSIRYRADRLLQQVVDAGGLEADELHFVGHSTGGLDIRLMLTPDVQLRDGDEEARVAERAVSAVSLATPHYGTPLATFFTSMQGRNLLRFLTVMATSDRGRYSIFAAAQFTRMIARLDDRLGRRNTMLDMVAEQLLNRLSLSKEDPFWRFLE